MKPCKTCGNYPRAKSQAVCKECQSKRRKGYYRNHAAHEIAKNRSFRQTRKQETISAYGGVCACCGETNLKFLTIDHVDGKGCEHRRQVGNVNMYDWLKKNKWPEGFQVLCFNCNCGKAHNGGVCPHKDT